MENNTLKRFSNLTGSRFMLAIYIYIFIYYVDGLGEKKKKKVEIQKVVSANNGENYSSRKWILSPVFSEEINLKANHLTWGQCPAFPSGHNFAS